MLLLINCITSLLKFKAMTNKQTEPRQWWESRTSILVLLLVTIFYVVYISKCQGDMAILTQ